MALKKKSINMLLGLLLVMGSALVLAQSQAGAAGTAALDMRAKKQGMSRPGAGPAFPRIANCYGAGVSPASTREELDETAKFDLLIGGFGRFNRENPEEVKKLREVLAYLKQKNPNIIVIDFSSSAPYTNPKDARFPKDGWLLTADQQTINGWPGSLMMNLRKPEVISYLAGKSKASMDVGFDGTFVDCMLPTFDRWACEIATKKSYTVDSDGDGKPDNDDVLDRAWIEAKKNIATAVREVVGERAMFLINPSLDPGSFLGDQERLRNMLGMWENYRSSVNGVLFEDELNWVMDLGVDWNLVVTRYLSWIKTPHRPNLTTIVTSSGVEPPFNLGQLPREEQNKYFDKARVLTKRMRFGLTTTLLGDGYHAYDLNTRARGQYWWYPEYDAPLGYPKGEAKAQKDGTWRREFDGGFSVVNPTKQEVRIRVPKMCVNVSDNARGVEFVVPPQDGYVLVYAEVLDK